MRELFNDSKQKKNGLDKRKNIIIIEKLLSKTGLKPFLGLSRSLDSYAFPRVLFNTIRIIRSFFALTLRYCYGFSVTM